MDVNQVYGKNREGIMKVRDVAEYLRLSEAKIYQMVNSGYLPSLRLGKRGVYEGHTR